MLGPISGLAIAKELYAAYPTLTKIWKRVTKAKVKDAGKRLLAFMESKQVFIERGNDVPYACYESSKLVFNKLAKERDRLPSPELMTAFLGMQDVCNGFKRGVEILDLTAFKHPDSSLEPAKRLKFRETITRFRYEMGVQVAALGEAWGVEVPRVLLPKELLISFFPSLKTR
jgi:hypothetical protein